MYVFMNKMMRLINLFLILLVLFNYVFGLFFCFYFFLILIEYMVRVRNVFKIIIGFVL